MKPWFRVVVVAVALYLAIGMAQIFVANNTARVSAKDNRERISKCLTLMFGAIESKKEPDGQFPPKLTTDLIPEGMGVDVSDFTYNPKAREFEPLISYLGDESGAKGYSVLGNGIVTKAKIRMSPEETASGDE